jgi:flagellar biosynthesis protein FlhB
MVLHFSWENDSITYLMLQVLTVFIGQQTVVPQCTTITTLLLLVAVDQFFWKIINWWKSLRMYGVYLHV